MNPFFGELLADEHASFIEQMIKTQERLDEEMEKWETTYTATHTGPIRHGVTIGGGGGGGSGGGYRSTPLGGSGQWVPPHSWITMGPTGGITIDPEPLSKRLVAEVVKRLKKYVNKIAKDFSVEQVESIPGPEVVERMRVSFYEGVMWAMENVPEIAAKIQAEQEAESNA